MIFQQKYLNSSVAPLRRGGRNPPELPAGILRIAWPESFGLGGRYHRNRHAVAQSVLLVRFVPQIVSALIFRPTYAKRLENTAFGLHQYPPNSPRRNGSSSAFLQQAQADSKRKQESFFVAARLPLSGPVRNSVPENRETPFFMNLQLPLRTDFSIYKGFHT